jgi:cytidylate kinase
VGRLLAARLGYRFIDTGNMYRALAWKALKLGIDPEDGPALARLAESTRLEMLPGEGAEAGPLVDGQAVAAALRSPEVERAVSPVSRFPQVRRALVQHQRRLARQGGVVMVGRDIGTHVLPRAGLKVFLEASPQERARRRHREVAGTAPEGSATYQSILAELERRDRMDSQRAVSPLRPATGAVIIDTEGLTPQEVADHICRLLNPA